MSNTNEIEIETFLAVLHDPHQTWDHNTKQHTCSNEPVQAENVICTKI